jgi:hypothetical protein
VRKLPIYPGLPRIYTLCIDAGSRLREDANRAKGKQRAGQVEAHRRVGTMAGPAHTLSRPLTGTN